MSSKRIVTISLILGLFYSSIFGFETKINNTSEEEVCFTVIQGESKEEFHVSPKSEKTFSYEIIDPFNIKYNITWCSSNLTWWNFSDIPIIELFTSQANLAFRKYDITFFPLTKEEKAEVSSTIKNSSFVYEGMKAKGFKIKMIDTCETVRELFALLDKYVYACPFSITISKEGKGSSTWNYKAPDAKGKYFNSYEIETKVINTTDVEVCLTVIQGESKEELHVPPQSEKTFSYEVINPYNISYDFYWGNKERTWQGYAEYPITEANTWQLDYASKKYDISFCSLTKDEKSAVSSMIRNTYIGYAEMKEKGFYPKMIDDCETIGELFALLDKYVYDYHFSVTIDRGQNLCAVWTFKNIVTDEKSKRSIDSIITYFEKATSNAYYIRFNSCGQSTKEYPNPYWTDFPKAASKACKYDYIVLDPRSNNGGGQMQQIKFFESLINKNYKGKIYILQDKYSFSAAEMWMIAGRYADKLDITTVGTFTGGMQRYGECKSKKKGNVSGWIPTIICGLPDDGKWKGEGVGYEPDVFAYTEEIKDVLTGFGVDMTGIGIQ